MSDRCVLYAFNTAIMAGVFLCADAGAIILHKNIEPNLALWTAPQYRPPANVVGRWSTNASFVVISPRWIITTCHQNTAPSTVDINGVAYNCVYNSAWTGGPTGKVDIRLVRLKNLDGSDPNLEYAPPYSAADETGKDIVIGGYGRGRASTLVGVYPQAEYGYTWDAGENYNNYTQRWCTNSIIGYRTAYTTRVSEVIMADFDDPCSTPYEGIPAEYDSGGGWFLKTPDGWKTIGITRAVTSHGDPWPSAGQSWYRNQFNPTLQEPDIMDAVRISSYSQWIISAITAADCAGKIQGDLNNNCKVDLADFALFAQNWMRTDCSPANNNCGGADFAPSSDGKVDILDSILFAQNWLTDRSALIWQ